MAHLTGVYRLGRDAELKHTANGTAVASLNLACNYGMKDQNGKKPTQWVDAALWGKPAEALVDYLVKGQAVYVVMDDPHVEEFQKKDGSMGHKLAARVVTIELVGKADGQQQAPSQHQQAKQDGYAPAPRPAPKPAPQFDDSDIPF